MIEWREPGPPAGDTRQGVEIGTWSQRVRTWWTRPELTSGVYWVPEARRGTGGRHRAGR